MLLSHKNMFEGQGSTTVKKSLFTTCLLLLVIVPCRKATNSADPDARHSTTDSVQLVDRIRTHDMSPNH